MRKGIVKVCGHMALAFLICGPALADIEKAAKDRRGSSSRTILQRLQTSPCKLSDGRFYVPAALETIKWVYLPNRKSKAILAVPSGSLVTFDTLSGEGMMEDQGRDPVKFFGRHGVSRTQVLDDSVEIAGSNLAHDFEGFWPYTLVSRPRRAWAIASSSPVANPAMLRFYWKKD